jgi:murein DD-endopeptidase MepM/ murein hydrolase activator NlpD
MKNGVLIAASSGSLSEALDEATYADSIQGQINEILDDIIAHKIFLENEKERYNREKSELAARQKQLEEERNALESSKIRAESLAEQNRTEINSLLGSIDSLTDKEKKLREEVMAINARLVASRRSSTISVADSPLGKIIWPSNVTYCSQGYGMTQFARQGWYGGQGHNGLDIAGSGSVLAVADGVVLARNSGNCPNGGFRSCAGGWGNWVAIRHSSGHVTLYTHLSGGASVSTGQSVSQGQVIGRIGNSGNSTGPHLHFSIYQSFGLTSSGNPDYAFGSTLNPENYYNVRCMDP